MRTYSMYSIDRLAALVTIEIPYERWIMRTNNFSSKKIAKSLAVVTLLAVCFVFAFAMTWSLASLSGDSSVDTALAGTPGDPRGGTTDIYGDNGNPLNFAQIGFDGFKYESGTYFWAFTESFDTKMISTGAGTLYTNNDSSSGLASYSYTISSPNPGGYSWSAESGWYSNIQLGVVHYRVPDLFKNIASTFTVTATVHANVSYSTTGGAGIRAATSKLTSLKSFYKEDGPATNYGNESVVISSSTTYLLLGFWGYKSNNFAMNGTNDGSVSDISVTFTISTTNASTVSSKCKEAFEDGNKVVAQSLYESGVTDSYAPYNTTINETNGTSTWPVWYESIKSNLSGAVDSVSGGKGTLASYTNKSLGSAGGQNYYKTTTINYVGTYQYAFPYSSGTCTGTDGNTTFAVGIKTVQVGDPDGTTPDDGQGAIFDVTSMSNNGTSSKAVYVENEKVGYATVKRVNRVKIQITTYVYKNADITTRITDTGYRATTESFKISYKGIDTQNPNAMNLDTSDKFATTAVNDMDALDANGKLKLNWWRTSVFANDVHYDELEEEVAPYLWFYRVDRADTLAELKTISARNYINYGAIKSAGLEPFAYGSLDSFEYDFATGTAKGIGGARIASVDSATLAKKSGYYRFTFYTVDLAGNMGTTMTYFVKADYDRPTFDTMIKFDPNGDDSWVTINSSSNGTWATGETLVFVQLIYDPVTKSFVNSNGTNISGNTLVFEAGADVFGIVFDKDKIVKRIEGSQYYDVNAMTTTYSKKVETDADKATLKVDYDASYGRIIFSFPDAPSASGAYPNIDWTTSFTMYAGQFYEEDDTVTATDGWSGGVKIRVDRNNPETPEIENEEGEYIAELLSYTTNISKSNRVWFTESGLKLDAVLKFADNLAESYGSGIKVYIGMKAVTSDEDFEDGMYNLVYFAQNFKSIPASDYSQYFGSNLTYIEGGNLDEGDTAITLRLDQTAGVGMRAIFVWAVDQAGNISDELTKYYVLADENTYTVTSSVKPNSELPAGSAVISQTNADEDYSTSFKRGDVITFTLDMDTDLYAPYLFSRIDGSGDLIVLSNYGATYTWNVVDEYADIVELDNDSLKISYSLDDYTTVGALSTMANRRITFEFAHRKIVEYTVTNSTSVPFTNAPTVVEMATDDAARSSFEYYYLDEEGDPMGVPTYPNSENKSYKVAIYISTNDPSFVVKNIVTKEEATGVPTIVDGLLEIGYQKVAFIDYTIVKGNVTITAIASSTNYGSAVTLDYTLTGLDKADAISKGFVAKLKLNADSSDYASLSVGDYQIIQDGAAYIDPDHPGYQDNFLQYYNVNYISAIHRIYTRPINISTVASNKTYGNADPDFKFIVNVDQFEDDAQLIAFFEGFTQDGDKDGAGNYTFWSDGIIRRTAGENVGEYSFVANSAMFDVNTNYTLSITNTAKFNITKRPVELIVSGQFLVKQASEGFDPAVDYASIVPTFTLNTADAQFEDQINGALALDSVWTDDGATLDYEHQYKFTVVLGTIANSNMTITLSTDKTFTVYVVAADAVVIKLRSDKAFNFVYGTPWGSTLVPYSFENFEGLEDGCEVNWTASIDGYSAGNVLDVGSYLVNITSVSVTKGGEPVNKVYVDSFNVTFTPAVVGVRPTYTKLVKAYGDPDSEFGFGWEIYAINGEAVGSDYAGNSVASIRNAISGAYARALFNLGTFDSLGTRYDDASDANGVLYSNSNKYYAFAVGTAFVSDNPNFVVDSALSVEDAATRFEVTRKELVLNSNMFTGLSKVVDGSVSVNYEAAGVKIVELRDMLVLKTDDVNLTFTNAYYDDPSTGDRTITFEGLYLDGAKAANYILTVTDLVDGKVTIAYIDNSTQTEHIKIYYGLIGLHRSDITIKKQYDGTGALNIANVSIQNRTENNIGTSMLINIMANGDAEVKTGEFTGSAVSNSYVLSVVLFFKVADPDIIGIYDYAETGLTVEKANLDNEWGVRVAITGIGGEIEKRVINSSSFASITPRTRDYNSRSNVEIDYEFADGAIVAGDNVTVTFAGEITTPDVGFGEHPIRFTAGAASNVNYRVDVDELNSTYNEANPLKVQIERAKLYINKGFKDREYDATTSVEFIDGTIDGYSNPFTTVKYSTELQAELSTFTIGVGTVEYNLSNKGVADPNVMIDRDGNVAPHDVLIHGLEVVGDAELLANYEIYGFRYTGSDYMAVGSIPSGVIEDFELLGVVSVSKKHISIVENDINVHDKVYDGTKNASASINVNELADVMSSDKPYLEITAHGEFDQKYVGYNVNVRISGVTLQSIDQEHEYLLHNYEITNASDVVLQRKIYARPVTFSFDLGSRVYSGDTYVSTNVIKETIEGLLPIDVKSYGIQVAGGAYFMDKNVAFEEDENGEYREEAGFYIALTESEKATYTGTRYSVGAKQGTVYNPIIKNTKAIYINYELTYSVAKADYVSGDYAYVKMNDGRILHNTDSSIDDANVEEYYFELNKAKNYILATDTAKLAAAGDNIIGYYYYNNQGVYLVPDSYTGEISDSLPEYVTYSNDAKGKIQKRAAIINEIQVLDETNFTKDYDGTTKFNGVAGVDYSYASTGIGLAGDDLEIVRVVAEFESASVGDTYVVIRADRLGGADANNYTYGTLRSARIPAKINKIKITAHLADGNMVYGTNLANVKGDITYTLGGKTLDFTDRGVMIKFDEFLKVVGILGESETVADLTEEDMRDMKELLQRIYIKDGDEYGAEPVAFDKDSADADKYYARLGGNFASLPKTSVLFPVARPSAGAESTSYTLKGGEAANFAFDFEYTDGATSHLTVVKRDIYVVAAIEDYQKEYGGIDPAITLNSLDELGRPAIVSGETWRNVFVKDGVDYRPDIFFSIFVDGVSDGEPITPTAKISADPALNGDYVLVISGKDGYVAENYEVHYGTVILIDASAAKNERYAYSFAGSSFVAKAPELTIVMPAISGVSLKDGTSFSTVYNRFNQAGVPLNGVRDGDVVKMVDANGNTLNTTVAGKNVGTIVLEREVFENDPNGYKLVWRSDVDGGVQEVTLEITKASPNLSAPRGSEQYNGQAHIYPYTRATVAYGLPTLPECFTTKYSKKMEGNYVEVSEMRDSGVYLVTMAYNSGNPNYEVQTIEIQFAITKAKVVVDIDYTARQLYEENKAYAVDYTISSISPTTSPALLSNSDLMVQFLLAGEGLLKVENGQVVPVDDSIIKIENGGYAFGHSGRYPFQVILKDSALKENFDITQNLLVDGKATSAPATGTLELVVTELQQVVDQDVKATIKVKDTEDLDKNLLADKFEARFVYKNNTLADDDAYYAKVDSAFMAEVEKALGTSVTISAIIRYNLTLAGSSAGLAGTPTTISVELTDELLNSLDSTVIYQTVLNSDGTTALKRLSGYEIKNGVLTYDTTTLGSIVFVKAGRETPMLAIWISVAVAGLAAVIITLTVVYIVLKKRRLKK